MKCILRKFVRWGWSYLVKKIYKFWVKNWNLMFIWCYFVSVILVILFLFVSRVLVCCVYWFRWVFFVCLIGKICFGRIWWNNICWCCLLLMILMRILCVKCSVSWCWWIKILLFFLVLIIYKVGSGCWWLLSGRLYEFVVI